MRTFCKISRLRGAGAATILVTLAGAAHPAVVISNGATQNMSCSNGVCEPTAVDAVLNTGDLETLLASGNVEVTSTGSGVEAEDIEVSDAFGWTKRSRLTLDAHNALQIDAAVLVEGKGRVAIATGTNGALSFGRKGHVSFADVSSSVSVDGVSYTLENSIKSLAKAIAKNPGGWFALANDYDASQDGTYTKAPIHNALTRGHFEGLGNTVSNLTIVATGGDLGLFAGNTEGEIRDIRVKNVSVTSTSGNGVDSVGTVVGANAGLLSGAHAIGSVTVDGAAEVGGLAGDNSNRGEMYDDDANVAVVAGAGSTVGGLVGGNEGPLLESYAAGTVKGSGRNVQAGGLVGWNAGSIENSYARGGARKSEDAGGLIGYNAVGLYTGAAVSSYSTGKVEATGYAGGVIGFDESSGAYMGSTYWDRTTSKITNRSQGAGSPPNDPGLKARTTKRLQAGLPKGFDPAVWAESATINDGFPYLLSDPPQ